jgi:hypothetical protein
MFVDNNQRRLKHPPFSKPTKDATHTKNNISTSTLADVLPHLQTSPEKKNQMTMTKKWHDAATESTTSGPPTAPKASIGAQCRWREETETRRAGKYFAKAQQIAFVDILQDPSLAMIRIFLMIAFYMLSACQRSTAVSLLYESVQIVTRL